MEYFNQYIFIKDSVRDAEKAFYFFIKNSKIELISTCSAYGMVFKICFIKSGENSPYFGIDAKGEKTNIMTMAIKILLMCDEDELENVQKKELYHDRIIWKYKDEQNKLHTKHFEKRELFLYEVKSQVEMAKRGILELNRNVPVVLFSQMFQHDSNLFYKLRHILLNKCSTKMAYHVMKEMFKNYEEAKNKKFPTNIYFGFLAMEYIDATYRIYCDLIKPIIYNDIKSLPGLEDTYKYDSLTLSLHSSRLRWLYNTTRYELLRLAVDTGYNQGDYHTENILMDEKTRLCIIIDFGKCKKIERIHEIREKWKEWKITNDNNLWKEILKGIHTATFDDLDEKHPEYQWLKNIDEEDLRVLTKLHEMREKKQEDQTAEIFYFYFRDKKESIYAGECNIHVKPMTGYEKIKNFIYYTFYTISHFSVPFYTFCYFNRQVTGVID